MSDRLQARIPVRMMGSIGLLVLLIGGCDVEPIDLNEKACDDEHPCVQGYVCVDEVCVREDAPDGGPAAANED